MKRRGSKEPIGQPCPCGRKAVKYASGWVCARCLGIEAQHARREEIRKEKAGSGFEVASVFRVHLPI